MRVERVHREPPAPAPASELPRARGCGRTAQRGYEAVVRSARHGRNALVRTPLLSVALPGLGLSAPRCFSEGDDGVLAWSRRIDDALDIGSFQYFSGNEKGLASLQGLNFPSLFGSPTWARTRDLRINRLPLDLPANPHERSLAGVRASNISCPFHLRKAWEWVI